MIIILMNTSECTLSALIGFLVSFATALLCVKYRNRNRMLKRFEEYGASTVAHVIDKVRNLATENAAIGLAALNIDDGVDDKCKCGKTHKVQRKHKCAEISSSSNEDKMNEAANHLDRIKQEYLKELQRLDYIMKHIFENEHNCFGLHIDSPIVVLVQYSSIYGENRAATVELGGYMHELMTRLMLCLRIATNGWTVKANKRYFSTLCGKDLRLVCPNSHSFIVTPNPHFVIDQADALDVMEQTAGCDALQIPMCFTGQLNLDACIFRVLGIWDNFTPDDRATYVAFASNQLVFTEYPYPELFAKWPLVRLLGTLFCSRGAVVKEDKNGRLDLVESMFLAFYSFMNDTTNIDSEVLESGILQKNPEVAYKMILETLLLFYYGMQNGKTHCDESCKCYPEPDHVFMRIPSSVHLFDRDTQFSRYQDGSMDLVCSYPPLARYLINAFGPTWRKEDMRTMTVNLNGVGVALFCTVSDPLNSRIKWVYDIIDAAQVDSVLEAAIKQLAKKFLDRYFDEPMNLSQLMWKFIEYNMYTRTMYTPTKGSLDHAFDFKNGFVEGSYEKALSGIEFFVAAVEAEWYMSRTRNIQDLLQEEDKVERKKQRNKRRKQKRKAKRETSLPSSTVEEVPPEDIHSDTASTCSSVEDIFDVILPATEDLSDLEDLLDPEDLTGHSVDHLSEPDDMVESSESPVPSVVRGNGLLDIDEIERRDPNIGKLVDITPTRFLDSGDLTDFDASIENEDSERASLMRRYIEKICEINQQSDFSPVIANKSKTKYHKDSQNPTLCDTPFSFGFPAILPNQMWVANN